MRFLFCDRIIQIRKGESIEGTKAFSLSEEFLNGHFEGRPIIPGALFMETMSQFLGWLIAYSHDFRCLPIPTLMDDVEVMPDMAPGFEGQVQARIVSTSSTDSLGKAEIHLNGEIIARANRMIYRHFAVSDPMTLQGLFHLVAGPFTVPGSTGKTHGE